MKKKDEVRQELKALGATKLASLNKRSARHALPEDYWNDQVDKAIVAGNKPSHTKAARQFSLSSIVTIAAGFLMLLAGTWMFFRNTNTESDTSLMANELTTISDEEIVKYIGANLDDFDLALLSDYVQETEHDLLFDVDASLDSMEDQLPEDTEWLMPFEEGVDLF